MQELIALFFYSGLLMMTSFSRVPTVPHNSTVENLKNVNFDPDDPDTSIVFHINQYFVELDSLIDDDTLQTILVSLNSTEVWSDDDLHMALWQIDSFPFITTDGDLILDINDAVTASKKKTRINNAALNIQQTIVGSSPIAFESCFDITNYFGTQGNESVKISILDTGISDISDNSNTQYNYNLTSYTGYDYVNNDSIPDDENGHGSHLAGIIHSITFQSNPASPRITFDIRKTHDAQGQAYMSAVVIALVDAMKEGADIINMSFSVNDLYRDTFFYPLRNVITEAEEEGVLVITSSGNSAMDNDNLDDTALPASFPNSNIISVASIGCDHKLSLFSNFGSSNVDVAILGENIIGPDLASGLISISGTSQAAAIVTALAALKGSKQNEFDYPSIKCALIRTSTHYLDLGDKVLSDGILNGPVALQIDSIGCLGIMDNCDIDFTGANALIGIQDSSMMYETNNQIVSSQIIDSSRHVSYDALMSTILNSGFEVKEGAAFQVSTNGCQN